MVLRDPDPELRTRIHQRMDDTTEGRSSVGIRRKVDGHGAFNFADHLADAAVGAGDRVEPADAALAVEEDGGGTHIDREGLEEGAGNDDGGEFAWQRGAK